MCDGWVRQHVLPKLPPKDDATVWLTSTAIRDRVLAFVQEHAQPWEFWAYFGDYDWVLFCRLFGRLLDLPAGFPHLLLDLKQELLRRGIQRSELPPNPNEHSALDDARWVRLVTESLISDFESEPRNLLALRTIRTAGHNEDATSQWMQQWAGWALARMPRPPDRPPSH